MTLLVEFGPVLPEGRPGPSRVRRIGREEHSEPAERLARVRSIDLLDGDADSRGR